MIRPVSFLLLTAVLCGGCGNRAERSAAIPCDEPLPRPSEYVSTLVGTQSDYTLSAGNTYPAVALPWGMNFWTPQTGEMGDGWAYTYGAHTIRGLKQTHQPSPWINDYGQFSLMPVRGHDKLDEESRQSWFSHQSETAKPYYYSVYLADHDVVAEMTPTERAAVMRFTFPESAESGVVIDAFDRGSRVEIIDAQTVAGYTTRNSGGVPENFRNWFVIRFDKPVSAEEVRQNLGQVFAQHADADASAISFEVKQYGNENQMRIVTQYRYDDTSDEATAEVEQIIYDAMKSLYSYDISFEQFRNTQTDVNGILTADKIGPSIAKDMTWNAIYSVLFSLIAIGLYITFRFKRWQWASGATIALAVNALFIIGLFSMLYGFVPFNLEVNQAFIAAILTIIGYAINDTVVVFDRIREYLGMYPKRNLKENVNNAINSTLSRTINTSGTTLVTLLAIFFFGGETIRGFIFALTVGVIVGTVATIFIATPIAYDLMSKRAKLDKEA